MSGGAKKSSGVVERVAKAGKTASSAAVRVGASASKAAKVSARAASKASTSAAKRARARAEQSTIVAVLERAGARVEKRIRDKLAEFKDPAFLAFCRRPSFDTLCEHPDYAMMVLEVLLAISHPEAALLSEALAALVDCSEAELQHMSKRKAAKTLAAAVDERGEDDEDVANVLGAVQRSSEQPDAKARRAAAAAASVSGSASAASSSSASASASASAS